MGFEGVVEVESEDEREEGMDLRGVGLLLEGIEERAGEGLRDG